MKAEKDFGWTGYKNLHWARDTKDGKLKFYEGRFKTAGDPTGITTTSVRFWSNRPKLAMRHIYEGSDTIRDVERWNHKEIIIRKRRAEKWQR